MAKRVIGKKIASNHFLWRDGFYKKIAKLIFKSGLCMCQHVPMAHAPKQDSWSVAPVPAHARFQVSHVWAHVCHVSCWASQQVTRPTCYPYLELLAPTKEVVWLTRVCKIIAITITFITSNAFFHLTAISSFIVALATTYTLAIVVVGEKIVKHFSSSIYKQLLYY